MSNYFKSLIDRDEESLTLSLTEDDPEDIGNTSEAFSFDDLEELDDIQD